MILGRRRSNDRLQYQNTRPGTTGERPAKAYHRGRGRVGEACERPYSGSGGRCGAGRGSVMLRWRPRGRVGGGQVASARVHRSWAGSGARSAWAAAWVFLFYMKPHACVPIGRPGVCAGPGGGEPRCRAGRVYGGPRGLGRRVDRLARCRRLAVGDVGGRGRRSLTP